MSEAKFTPELIAASYEVMADGRVYSIAHNWRGYGRRELTQTLNDDCYPSVRLSLCGARVHLAVHKLVAMFHLPPRPTARHELRHLDGNKLNRCASNLCWGTKLDNAADRERHGRTSRGHRHSLFVKNGITTSTNQYYRHAR